MPRITTIRPAAGFGLMLEVATSDASLHIGRRILSASWPARQERNLLAVGVVTDPYEGGLRLGLGPVMLTFTSTGPRWIAA